MKKLFLVFLLLSSYQGESQISIDMTDMPSAGDIIVLSEVSPLTAPVDVSLTGTNYIWDFSQLSMQTQNTDTFLDVSTMGTIYSLFYINNQFNPNRSNVAVRGSLPAIPGVTITDVYNFNYNSTTSFRQSGFGATINGIQVPVAYGSKDIIYNFPLDFADTDTSISDIIFSIPGTGSLNSLQTRINTVDGWGTVITPYDSFPCLRMVSTVNGHDSIYIDSLSQGMGFDRITLREYKWLAKGRKAPVLQINTQEFVTGTETVVSIEYLDTLQITSLQEKQLAGLKIYPNPANDKVNIYCNTAGSGHYKLINMQGSEVAGGIIYLKKGQPAIIDISKANEGIYILTLHFEDQASVQKLLISR